MSNTPATSSTVTFRASSYQTALTVTGATAYGVYGFASAAERLSVINQLEEIRATLTARGDWKGSA